VDVAVDPHETEKPVVVSFETVGAVGADGGTVTLTARAEEVGEHPTSLQAATL